MSTGSTPSHTSSLFDSYYDPDFTAEISAKMHVPDKICVGEGMQNATPYIPRDDEFRNMMNVPERIIVAGKFLFLSILIVTIYLSITTAKDCM